jgi:arsenate reductase
MAEGMVNKLVGDRFEAYSAGTKASVLNPRAAKVMGEIGIDISHQRSKSVKEFEGVEFDYVVTVCNNARETCPYFPGAKKYIHRGFDDPGDLFSTDEDGLGGFRRVRDEIKDWI